MTPNEKDAASGETEKSPDPANEKTPFQRFEEFAKRVISVPKKEIEERERTWQDKRKKA